MIAETWDELSTLDLPPDEPPSISSTQNDAKSSVNVAQPSEPQPKAHSSPYREDDPLAKASEMPSPGSTGKPRIQAYPLYPSIAQLLHEKNIPTSEADKIPASGPKGRLLKGDVLAYIGRIPSSYSSDQSRRISKLGHLDLSNVKSVPSSQPSDRPFGQDELQQQSEPESSVTKVEIPISLSSIVSVQRRIQATLGVTLPLSTFLARVTDLANQDLPRPATAKATTDELFNDILGLNKISFRVPTGGYSPQITALPAQPFREAVELRRPLDVYDILTDGASPKSTLKGGSQPSGTMAGSEAGEAINNTISVSAEKGEEMRARVFLGRMKTFLQVEPGKLIL